MDWFLLPEEHNVPLSDTAWKTLCLWFCRRSAWRNEVSAPELLSLDEHLVSDLLQQVENQQEIVDDAR